MSQRGGSRGSLPTISNPQLTYSQRYEHMTKLANYGELNEIQIWKEYQKLRACLKQLNQQVLHHMEKKAFGGLKQQQKPHTSRDQEGTLVLLEDQKKTNETRLQNYNTELTRHQQRIKYLMSKPNYLDNLTVESQQLQLKIKQVIKQNKDLKRNAELQGRDLVNNNSLLDKLVIEEQKLNRAFKQHKKYDEHMKMLNEKIERFKDKNNQLQKAIHMRVEQFSKTQNYIAEEIHYDHYEELKKQKEVIGKYQGIYKRNYLIKLKELEHLVNNIGKHEKIIHENDSNITNVRGQIDTISGLIGEQRKRNQSLLMSRKLEKMSVTHQRVEGQVQAEASQTPPLPPADLNNDKNRSFDAN